MMRCRSCRSFIRCCSKQTQRKQQKENKNIIDDRFLQLLKAEQDNGTNVDERTNGDRTKEKSNLPMTRSSTNDNSAEGNEVTTMIGWSNVTCDPLFCEPGGLNEFDVFVVTNSHHHHERKVRQCGGQVMVCFVVQYNLEAVVVMSMIC
jgi:hypothetical protein